MNSAARLLNQEMVLSRFSWAALKLTASQWCLAFLLLSVTVTAFSLVYVTNQTRDLYVALQRCQSQEEHVQVEWGQLLLEKNTLSSPSRVAHIAKEALHMVRPVNKAVIFVGK